MRRLNYYFVSVGDDLGDPDYWNRRYEDIDLRLHGQEEIEKDWRSAVLELQENGLKRLDEAVAPLVEQLEEDLQLGAVFISESSASVEVKTGPLTIGITAANKRRYSPAAYLALVTRDAPYAVMLGRLINYDRETGSLAVDIERTFGAGDPIRANWIISATSHIDYQADRVYRSAGGGLNSTTVEAALLEILQLVPAKTRSITAGTGLSGGGDLSDDRQIGLDLTYTDTRYVRSQDYDTHRHPWSEIDVTPTTLSGYGISDAYTKTEVDSALAGKQAKLNYTPENAANKGTAGGYAPLGPDGKIAGIYLPVDGSFKGTYDASTNTPEITSGSGTQGDFWIVSVGGTVAADSVGVVAAGDQLRRGPDGWQRVPTFNAVSSVAGKTGTVTLEAADLTDSGEAGRALVQAETIADAKTALALTTADLSDFATSWTARLEAVTSAFARTLLDDPDAAAMRATLQLGSAAQQASTAFAPAGHVGASGTGAHPDASTSASGFMSASDKSKLNGIAANANAYVHPTGDGNLHVPATGTGSNKKVLTAGSTAGSMTWTFVDWQDVTGKPTTLSGYGITDAYSANTVDTLLSAKQDKLNYTAESVSNKGTANGYASLDGTGKIPTTQLPALAIVDTFVVATQAAMLSLAAQKGDVAVRQDVNKSFILRVEPASTLANWEELRTPTDVVQSVAGRQGAVTLTSADLTDSGAFGRSLVGTANQAAARTALALTPGTDVLAYDVGVQQIANLADPNADRLLFWDDSASTYAYLLASTGLAISGTSLSVVSASETQSGISEMATAAETITGTDTVRSVHSAGLKAALDTRIGGRDDLIINGCFDIAQRGTSQSGSGYGSLDRWVNAFVGGTVVQSQQPFAVGDTLGSNSKPFFSRQTVSGQSLASHAALREQRIEDVRSYAGQTITVLGFARRSSGAGNMAVGATQNFGTGGSPSSTVVGIGAQQVSLSTLWQPFAVTITVPSLGGKTLGTNNNHFFGLNFWASAGANFNVDAANLGLQTIGIDLFGIHVRKGAVPVEAVAFYSPRHPQDELALCHRYYEAGGAVRGAPYVRPSGVSATDPNNFATVQFKRTKRATPTMIGGAFYASLNSWTDVTVHSATAFLTANSTGGEAMVNAWSAESEL